MDMKNQLEELMYKDKVWSVIGFITFNKGSFLYLYNESEIINLDLFKVKGLSQYFKDDVMKATESEIFMANYINDKLTFLNLDLSLLKSTINNFNTLIQNSDILTNLLELDSNPNKLEKNKNELTNYFDELFDGVVCKVNNDNELSKTDNFNENIETNKNKLELSKNNNVVNDEVHINSIENNENLVNEKTDFKQYEDDKKEQNMEECVNEQTDNLENSFYGPYNEKEVTEYLKSNINQNISEYVIAYLNQFNEEQIDFILSNYNLNDKLKETLRCKKVNLENNKGKNNNFKNNADKKNTVVDIMFLVFVIGLIAALYVMYLYINLKL